MDSFSGQENMRVVMNGHIRVGRTRPIPSGSFTNRPPTSTVTTRGSVGRMIESASPSSRHSSSAAGR